MAQSGTLISNVYSGSNTIPISGVSVLVTRAANGQTLPELVNFQTTDSSGLTRPIQIDTPDASVSLTPDGGVGWTEVTVIAQHPLYERIVVTGVQVFPGVETVQNFQLIPLASIPEVWNRTEIYDITEQDL